jgi:putative ABC transport system substrate-binding protein
VTGRRAVVMAAGAIGAAPGLLLAQPPERVRRIGTVRGSSEALDRESQSAFLEGLRDLGWVEGRNLRVEQRWADGRNDRFPALVAELLALKVEVVVVSSTPGAQAAVRATREIPIVFAMVSDPVASGIVASLAHPGGNATGWSNTLPDMGGKLLGLLLELAPGVAQATVLWNPDNHGKRLELDAVQAAARSRKLAFEAAAVRDAAELRAALAAFDHARPQGLVVFIDSLTRDHRADIALAANRLRIPAVYQDHQFVQAGGLASYGVDFAGEFRRMARHVDRILRGARPADLPVEQPIRLTLALNRRTAAAIGLTIPPQLLLRADEVIT